MRYTYHGEMVPRFIPVCVWEGFVDGAINQPDGQLYRYPWYKRIGYYIGYHFVKKSE